MNAQDETARSSSSLRAAPVTAREFASRMSSLDAGKTVAVAFSGGPDSLALLLLASRWVRGRKGAKLHAFTVSDTVGSVFIVMGLFVYSPHQWPILSVVMISFVLWNTIFSYLLAVLSNR